MGTRLNDLRREIFGGQKRSKPYGPHEEQWLVNKWPVYVARFYTIDKEGALNELRGIAQSAKTPRVDAVKKQGQTVKQIDPRELGELEVVKVRELLEQYKKKYADMGPINQELSKQATANAEEIKEVVREECADQRERLATLNEEMRELKTTNGEIVANQRKACPKLRDTNYEGFYAFVPVPKEHGGTDVETAVGIGSYLVDTAAQVGDYGNCKRDPEAHPQEGREHFNLIQIAEEQRKSVDLHRVDYLSGQGPLILPVSAF